MSTITIGRQGCGYRLKTAQRFPWPIDEVFPFFADALNLESITPPSLRFRILNAKPILMREGATIDYRLRIGGVPMRWRSEITVWEPPFRFVDEQRRGPYRWWVHEHRFEEDQDKTVMIDRVDYGVPGGVLAQRLFVGPALRRIFDFRAQSMRSRFG